MAVNLAKINIIAVILSIPIIATGIWLKYSAADSCVKFLQWSLIILGVLVFIVALAGSIGGFCRIQCLLTFYLIFMLVLIIFLVSLVGLVYMVTIRGNGTIQPNNRAYLEYHLEVFHRMVISFIKWDDIRSCITKTIACAELNQRFKTAQDFFNANLTPLQSGCCKPPTQCGYTFVNSTYWISPINTAEDTDCLKWSNNQTQLCYDCDSCKAGLLANLGKESKMAIGILSIIVIVLVAIYMIGYCAFRNPKTED